MNVEENLVFTTTKSKKAKIKKAESLEEMKSLWLSFIYLEDDCPKINKKIAKVIKETQDIEKLKAFLDDINRLEKVYNYIKEAIHNVNTLLADYKNDFVLLNTPERIHSYISHFFIDEVAIDTETTGLNTYQDRIVGVSLFSKGMKSAYIPINHVDFITGERAKNQVTEKEAFEELKKLYNYKLIMFNANFDIRVLRRIGLYYTCWWDTSIAAHLLDENLKNRKLKFLHQKYVMKGEKDAFSFGDLFDTKIMTFADIPINVAAIYAARDAQVTYELKEFQARVFNAPGREDLRIIRDNVFFNIEMPIVEAVINMEDTGFAFNFKHHEKISKEYHDLLNEKEQKIKDIIEKNKDKIEEWRKTEEANYKEEKRDKEGNIKLNKKGETQYKKSKNEQLEENINIGSPTQLAILLYDILKIPPPISDPPRSTGEEALKLINNELSNAILEFRHFYKLVTSFIDTLPEAVETDGCIHCNLNQCGTSTGRQSCSSPNLQQIPAGNDAIRRLFMAKVKERDVEMRNNKFILKNTEEVQLENGNWVFVKDLKVGDILQIEDGKPVEIKNIEKLNKSIEVTIQYG